MPNKAVLTLRDVEKRYDNGTEAVRGVSFDVREGEIFGILGPNGAGKTTTLEMIETLNSITAGSITLFGVDVAEQPQEIKKLIGVQPQAPGFQDRTKLREVLEMFAAAYGTLADPVRSLEEVGLADKVNSYVEELSGGQRQRFSIAVALVHDPRILFMDEPTTGLDPQARRNLWELVETVRKRGVTVIMTTHYMDEAHVLCDRIAIMDEGKIIALDTPKNLIQQLLGRGFKKEQHVEQANLEDVFIDLTGKELRE
ncbi:MAG: ABC transporter ATP-binding protein [Patescibacteria group bacterium]|nr:ABC transporter ATP-binding protein [Patescibacteria group bacterium]